MNHNTDISKFRMFGEVILVSALFFLFMGIFAMLFYHFQEGFTKEAFYALQTPDGLEKAVIPSFLATPVSMLATVLLIFGLQKSRGEALSDLGLKRPPSWPKALIWGVGIAVVIYVLGLVIQIALQQFGHQTDISSLLFISEEIWVFVFALTAISWISAGFCEEVIFRGFLLRHLTHIFGGANKAVIAAVIAQAAIFGALHLYEGIAGGIIVFFIALTLGFFFYKVGKNLWPLIIGHGLFDNFQFILLYFFADS